MSELICKLKELDSNFGIDVGNRVKRIRNSINISRHELANKCGVRLSTIDNLEKGKCQDPKGTLLNKIALNLNVSLLVIYGYESIPKIDDLFIHSLEQLNSDQLEVVKNVVEGFVKNA